MGQYPVFVVMYILNLSAHYKVNTVWRFSMTLLSHFARCESKQSELLCFGKGGSWKGVGTTFVTLLSTERNSRLSPFKPLPELLPYHSLASWYGWFGMVHMVQYHMNQSCNATLFTMMSVDMNSLVWYIAAISYVPKHAILLYLPWWADSRPPSSSASLSEGVNKSSSGKLVWIVWCGTYGAISMYNVQVCKNVPKCAILLFQLWWALPPWVRVNKSSSGKSHQPPDPSCSHSHALQQQQAFQHKPFAALSVSIWKVVFLTGQRKWDRIKLCPAVPGWGQ